jgi:hypothetical protein
MPLLSELIQAEELLALYHASELPGEQYHPDYQKDMAIFRKLTRSDMQTENELRTFFDKQAKRVIREVDWDAYEKRKAGIMDLVKTSWSDEKLKITLLLTQTLMDALEAGGEYTEMELGQDIGWSGDDAPATRFMNLYTPKLAGELTDTTIDRIRNAIKLSIQLGESTKVAKGRLYSTISDKKRSATIAHTESVRAFTGGRLMVGFESGADRKQWDATSEPCPICASSNGETVRLDAMFSNGKSGTPGHPNCRCLIKLLFPENGKPKQWDIDIAKKVVEMLSY